MGPDGESSCHILKGITMDYLEAIVDKFVFRVARDCRYNEADIWIKRVDDRVRVGLTDFLQQKSGDVAFVNLPPIDKALKANDELVTLETIKVDVAIASPISGLVIAVNDALNAHPELVNSDSYGAGWLVEMTPGNWADFDALPDAETYLPQMHARARLEQAK
jgi:glycine cleavage system H protein